jgi:hypothetical protein
MIHTTDCTGFDRFMSQNGCATMLTDSKCENKAVERKATPVFSGVLKYFPDAIMEVARCSQVGNDQHNPDQPLHWAREKSGDELDALARHLIGAGTMDDDGVRHSTKVAWRALANLQKELERAGEAKNSQYNQ